MSKVAIIGVGDVGATLAYTIQLSGVATEIVLIDTDRTKAESQALDMSHGLFFVPPVNIYAGGYSDCREAKLLIITAGARQKPGETRLELVERNAQISQAIVEQVMKYIVDQALLLVITNPVDLMTYTVLKSSGLPPGRVLGSGTVLDSARFRYALSQRCGVDPRNVHAYVIGEHGDSEVLLWSHANIGGVPLEWFCKGCIRECTPLDRAQIDEEVRRSAYHIIEAKGFTNYGVSLAVLRIVEAILRDEHSVLTVSTWLNGEYGIQDICLSVPCLIGSRGIERVVQTSLAPEEHEALKRSAEIVKSTLRNLGY